GGMNAKNIAKAIELMCSDFDINSGVESEPGQKDKIKLNEVFEIIRSY
ncbi:bifunctional indole-3-glycerol phosphate synthase/phosphoribosylanthranilate isomerase, partial [Francisella tularensis subsp. holarctica]|nr:bifunctional indole-3-glycerol phosphate synthase/phosphoribosylanthranilate isomerase [Francisella tularensis subsp. holarctica]